jgi:hypothetical protein
VSVHRPGSIAIGPKRGRPLVNSHSVAMPVIHQARRAGKCQWVAVLATGPSRSSHSKHVRQVPYSLGAAQRQRSPTAAGTRDWRRIQRRMDRGARTRNARRRFEGSGLVRLRPGIGSGNPALIPALLSFNAATVLLNLSHCVDTSHHDRRRKAESCKKVGIRATVSQSQTSQYRRNHIPTRARAL